MGTGAEVPVALYPPRPGKKVHKIQPSSLRFIRHCSIMISMTQSVECPSAASAVQAAKARQAATEPRRLPVSDLKRRGCGGGHGLPPSGETRRVGAQPLLPP